MSEAPAQSRRSRYLAACRVLMRVLLVGVLRLTGVCGHTLRVLLKALVIVYFIFAVLFLIVRHGVLPMVPNFKNDIELSVSNAIGRKINFGSLQVSWRGVNPSLHARNVVLHDQSGTPVLQLPEVSATLSWWSLLVLDVRFTRIEITRPSLHLQRLADGKYEIAGFVVDPHQQGDGAGLDWIFAQREIVIRDGTLNWSDHQNNQIQRLPDLQVNAVTLLLDNNWRHHRFALKATPPTQLAAPVDIRGDFQHPVFAKHIADVSQWSGELYTDLRQTDLAALKRYVHYPIDLQRGFGTVRAWSKFDQGRVVDLAADVRLSDVVGKLAKDLPLLDMADISGRIVASEKAPLGAKYLPRFFGQTGHSIALEGFAMRTRDGLQLPATTIKETYVAADDKRPEKVEITIQLLDLQTLATFAEHLPLPADQRQMLTDFAPKGQLQDFTASWEGSYPNVSSYQFNGTFVNLSLASQPAQLAHPAIGKLPAKAGVPAIPGFEHLSGTVNATDKGGRFILDSKDLVLQLPSYFVAPTMPFVFLKMDANWQIQAQDKLLVRVHNMEFQQETMRGSFSGQHVHTMRGNTQGEAHLGEIDLVGKLSGVDVKKLDRFIPVDAPTDLRHWLTNALLDGRLDDVSVKIKGDLAHFPYVTADGKPTRNGEFLVKGKIVDGKLDFAPGMLSDDGVSSLWPAIDSIKGTITFDHARMEIKADSAKTLGTNLSKVIAIIPDLAHPNSMLNIDGNVSGSLQSMLQYVNASPVNVWLGRFLEETKSTANAQLALQLNLPLMHLHDAKAHGALQFGSNDVVLQPGMPVISTLNGKLEFTEKGVSLNTLRGNLLGGVAIATGGSQRDGSVRVRLEGMATADGIKKALPPQIATRIGSKINGAARYGATISVKKHQPDIVVDSNLQGLALDFPSPLRKPINDAMPLHVELNTVASTDVNFLRDEIKIGLGNTVNVRYQRRKSIDRNASWQMLRGGIGVNAPAPAPDSGLSANIDFPVLNLDEWQSLLSASLPAAANEANTAPIAPTDQPVLSAIDLSAYIEPGVIAVRTNELQVMGKKIQRLVLGASHQRGLWQANMDSTQASGYISWSESNAAQGAGNVTARLSRLFIPQSAASDVSDLLEGKNTATQIPALDIVADDFELFNKKLGRLELVATNNAVAGGREWRINQISLINDDAEFKGTGKWSNRIAPGSVTTAASSSGSPSSTDLNYQLNIKDAGKLLERFGFANVVRGGKGKLEGDLHWSGLPFSLDTPSLSGQLQLDLSAGQFLKVEPGAAKLLGVLSMQSLTRRLTLDFRDVFSDGFAFDSIIGSARIQQGIAKTDNLKMRSVNATVLLDGTADIVKESQNLHVAVIPVVNAGTASVMYGLAVNPAIGLGTFLAQLFLREPLARAFTYEYQVTGSWKDPSVIKYDNKVPLAKSTLESK